MSRLSLFTISLLIAATAPARAGDPATEFRERYAQEMAKVKKQLGVPAPEDIYRINEVRMKQRPRLYFEGLSKADLLARAADPRYAESVAEIRRWSEAMRQRQIPATLKPDAHDPGRFYGDGLAWMAMDVMLESEPEARAQKLEGLLRWTRAFDSWGVLNVDLVVAQANFGFCTVYDWLGDELPPKDRAAIRAMIIRFTRESLDDSRPNFTSWRGRGFNVNHNWFNYASHAVAAFTLWGDTDAPLQPGETKAWLDGAMINFWIAHHTHPTDGASPEGPNYQDYGMRPYVDFISMAESLCVLKESFYDDNMRATSNRVFMLLPDGMNFMVYADGYPNQGWGSAAAFRKLATQFQDSRLQLVSNLLSDPRTRTSDPRQTRLSWRDLFVYDPSLAAEKLENLPLVKDFDDFGLYTARSSWKEDASFFALRCGPFWGKSVTKAFGESISGGHGYPNMGEVQLYMGKTAILPGCTYQAIRRTSNHSVVVFASQEEGMLSVGQVGEEGKAWFWIPDNKQPQRMPDVLEVRHTPEYHQYMADLGGVYRIPDSRVSGAVFFPSYYRSVVYLPEGAVVIVDRVTCPKPRTMDFRLLTDASDLKVVEHGFELSLDGKGAFIRDFSPQNWERIAQSEDLTTQQPLRRDVATLRANDVTSAVFATVMGLGEAGKKLVITTDDLGYTLTGAPVGSLRVDWPTTPQ